jgi:hypothetical protein
MRREQLESAVHAQPFLPFRVILTNGREHEVRHPEMFVMMTGSAFIGYPDPLGQGADRFAIVDLSHIAELEPLAPTFGGGTNVNGT